MLQNPGADGMRTLEYGKEHEKTLLFLPCTAEPEWAFADSVGLL